MAASWYDPNHSFFQPAAVTNLTKAFQNMTDKLVQIEKTTLPVQSSTLYYKFIQQVQTTLSDPTKAFLSYDAGTVNDPGLQLAYLSSITTSTQCTSLSFKDTYTNDLANCPPGTTQYDLSAPGANTAAHSGQPTCILLQSCSQLKTNVIARYASFSSCSAVPSQLVSEAGATY